MIEQTSFPGVTLRTQRSRRTLVLIYYGILVLGLGALLWKQKFLPGAILIQTFTLGSFFGGIRSGGLVKPYSERTPEPDQSCLQELNLSGIRPFSMRKMLDERELHERDHAHYTAYRILRWSFCAFAGVFVLGMVWQPGFFTRNAPNIFWGLTVYVLSLPQSVILWNEPELLSDPGLALVGAAPR
jgi:hypothetical protein